MATHEDGFPSTTADYCLKYHIYQHAVGFICALHIQRNLQLESNNQEFQRVRNTK